MITKILLCIAGVVLFGTGYVLLYAPQSVKLTDTATTTPITTNETDDTKIVRVSSSPDRAVYVNQEWRFSFEYPKGWQIREPAFGSATTLFNLAIWPKEENIFDPVTVNLTPKWWMDRLLEKKEGDIRIGGKDGWYYQSVTMSVIPNMVYTVLIHNEYWITIGIQNEYLDNFQMVLDTFQFHEPLPTLDDLEIDPPMPGQTRKIQ